MTVGFAGTPDFAATALAAILDAGHAVPLVLTQPDRPRGRGLQLAPGPVKAMAVERSLTVMQPPTLKPDDARAPVVAVPVDVLVVAAYGLILPPAILAWPRHGGINLHASLLPRWRGAAPIQRALLAGDGETGITVMQMDAGLDTGPMIDTVHVAIPPRATAGSLTALLADAAAAAIVATLARLDRDGRLAATPQPAEGATYAAKLDRADAAIDWRDTATAIDRRIRALDPAPGAFTMLGGEAVKLWRAEPVAGAGGTGAAPGTVLATSGKAIVVACGEGALSLTELQPAGSRRMDAAAFVAGRRLVQGVQFTVSGA
ncbi:MAG: methionyl-tRNA formyltransferase [Betaproteobacteria bacterium]